MNSKLKITPWTPEQDDLLFELAAEYIPKNWKLVSKELNLQFGQENDKSSIQCKQRYEMLFTNKGSKGNWNQKQLFLLNQSLQEYGAQWRIIQEILAAKTQVAIKNKFNGTIKYFLRIVWKLMGNKPSSRLNQMLPTELLSIYNGKAMYNGFKILIRGILKKLNFNVTRKSVAQIMKTQCKDLSELLNIIHQNVKKEYQNIIQLQEPIFIKIQEDAKLQNISINIEEGNFQCLKVQQSVILPQI